MQLTTHLLGGRSRSANKSANMVAFMLDVHQREAGLFAGLDSHEEVWMSHGDLIVQVPEGFSVTASGDHCPVAAFREIQPVKSMACSST